MGASFFVCDPASVPLLDRLVDAMEAEEVLDEGLEDSAYDRFAEALRSHQRALISLDEAASAPAFEFYSWFHGTVSEDLDKLYLTPEEAARALERLKSLRSRKGDEKLINGFWQPSDDFTREVALAYLGQFQTALEQAVSLHGVLAVAYDP